MTDLEKELVSLIRGCQDQAKALEIAIETTISFLKQLESSETASAVCPREQV